MLLLLALFFGFDPSVLLQGGGAPDCSTEAPAGSPATDPVRDFVSVVLADKEDTWRALFRDMGRTYSEPKLVLFNDAVHSACGVAGATVGPFYCPSDRRVYLDLSFFRALKERFGAPGDFAQAYVIAHEVGIRPTASPASGGYHAERRRQILEAGDLEEALRAAAAIGDDRLQQQSRGRVAPESFTHGTSAQRVRWFRRGFESGDPRQCDTFATARP